MTRTATYQLFSELFDNMEKTLNIVLPAPFRHIFLANPNIVEFVRNGWQIEGEIKYAAKSNKIWGEMVLILYTGHVKMVIGMDYQEYPDSGYRVYVYDTLDMQQYDDYAGDFELI